MSETGIILQYQSQVDLAVEWGISNFFNLPERDGAYYTSPEFSFGGERWFLGIYPNGWSGRASSGHLDLRLYKCYSVRSMRQSFSLSLKTAKGKKYKEEHGTKDFNKEWDYHEINRFIERSELTMKSSELVPEGVLTVVCTMENTTSDGSNSTGFPQLQESNASVKYARGLFGDNSGNYSVTGGTGFPRPQGWNALGNNVGVYGGQSYGYRHVGHGKYSQGGNSRKTDEELLEAKSEIDKLKLNYNQALQDKAEAQTKLRVLTNNFKEKETQLQWQLSAKEADVNSAKRRIMLIEQENASYKSQVARLKQEMEEIERPLKRQIAAQEKKADENMIRACTAEKNLENMEQEVTQLQQRLTLLEREQESCANAARDEIIRPVPKTCVEAYIQTEEERLGYELKRAYVEVYTQTLEEEFSSNNLPEDCGCVTDINHLLKENTSVDVIFELETPSGKTKLFAHKLILSVMSSHFADEFYDERSKGHKVIPIEGVSPKAFEQMIRYCYGEKPSLRTTDDAYALFKVASEFKVMGLQNLCHTFFRHTKIEPRNVFSILKISIELEDQSFQDMCYQILQEKTREVMAAYDLCDITPAMVYTLLNLPKLSLSSEYELINWTFTWAKVKSEDKNSSCRSTRDYLAKLLQNMNFLALTVKEFAMLTRENPEFFNSDEIASVSLNIVLPGTREMPVWYNKDLKGRVYTGSKE